MKSYILLSLLVIAVISMNSKHSMNLNSEESHDTETIKRSPNNEKKEVTIKQDQVPSQTNAEKKRLK